MKIMLVDDRESRRVALAVLTGAEVVRRVPPDLGDPEAVAADFDAMAFGGIGCAGGWAYDIVKDGRGYGRRRGECPEGFASDPGWCGCTGYRDALRWLRDGIDEFPTGFRIVFIGGPENAAGKMQPQHRDAQEIDWRANCGMGEAVIITVVSPRDVAELRTAFGMPLDFEVTP